MFPIHDGLGRLVAFGGRTLTNDAAKYMNSPETPLFSKSRVLFGFDQARRPIEQARKAIVVEGYMDAVLLHQHGFMNVVATLGTALTDAHAKLLKPLVDELYLCFDGDDAGFRAADRAVELALRGGFDVRVVMMPPGIDPADCVVQSGPAGFQPLLQSAAEALQFKWNRTFTSFSDRGPRGRRMAVEEFIRFVATTSVSGGVTPFEQTMLIGRLADMLAVPAETVHELLRRAKVVAKPAPKAPVTPSEEWVSDASAYDEAIAGLPHGLVTVVEELFGLLAMRPDCCTRSASKRWNRPGN
jgi:DNA primase